MTFKLARSNPEILSSHKLPNTSNKFRVAIAISKKVSKKGVKNRFREGMCVLVKKKEKNNKPKKIDVYFNKWGHWGKITFISHPLPRKLSIKSSFSIPPKKPPDS